jgi:uncharacterized protein YceK
MCRRALTGLAAVAAAALAGCGTTLNLDGESRVYGGVVQDFQIAKDHLAKVGNPGKSGTQDGSACWNLTASALALIDVPLSVVGDTLSLPLTIQTAMDNWDYTVPPTPAAKSGGPQSATDSSGSPGRSSVSMGR